MGVAGSPDEDGLLGHAGLGEGGDGVAVIAAKLLSGIQVDDPIPAEAHVNEIEGPSAARPGEHSVDHRLEIVVVAGESGQRYRSIGAAAGPEGNGEHRDIGAPGDAAGRIHIGSVRVARPAHDHACDCGAMGALVADLVRRPGQKFFGHRLAGEHRMPGIDPGVDHADGLAASRRRPRAKFQFELCVRPVRADRAQPPLVLESVFLAVIRRQRIDLPGKLLGREAAKDLRLDASRHHGGSGAGAGVGVGAGADETAPAATAAGRKQRCRSQHHGKPLRQRHWAPPRKLPAAGPVRAVSGIFLEQGTLNPETPRLVCVFRLHSTLLRKTREIARAPATTFNRLATGLQTHARQLPPLLRRRMKTFALQAPVCCSAQGNDPPNPYGTNDLALRSAPKLDA